MNEKNILKDEILLRMRNHLDSNEISILESTLSEVLYNIDILKRDNNLPAKIDSTNNYILNLFELRRSIALSKNTIKEYLITAKEFLSIVDISLIKVTQDDIEYYLAYKKRKGCSNTTLNNKRRYLKSLFEFMKKNGFITNNPVDNVESFKEITKPVDYLTAVDFDQLKTGCLDLRDRAILEWLRSTAMRVGEISNVRIDQIDWCTGKVLIYGEKTNTYRLVMLDSLAKKHISEYIIKQRGLTLDSSLPLFTYIRGDKTKPLGDKGIQAEIRRIGKRSGLDRRIYPHLFRKTTASNIVRRGGNVEEAGYYLGHKPQGVTAKHYAGMPEEQIRQIFYNYVESV